jgi:hypothetical protein
MCKHTLRASSSWILFVLLLFAFFSYASLSVPKYTRTRTPLSYFHSHCRWSDSCQMPNDQDNGLLSIAPVVPPSPNPTLPLPNRPPNDENTELGIKAAGSLGRIDAEHRVWLPPRPQEVVIFVGTRLVIASCYNAHIHGTVIAVGSP